MTLISPYYKTVGPLLAGQIYDNTVGIYDNTVGIPKRSFLLVLRPHTLFLH